MTIKQTQKNISAEPDNVVTNVSKKEIVANANEATTTNFNKNIALMLETKSFYDENDDKKTTTQICLIPLAELVRIGYLLQNYYNAEYIEEHYYDSEYIEENYYDIPESEEMVDNKIAAAVVFDSELDENSPNLLPNSVITRAFYTRAYIDSNFYDKDHTYDRTDAQSMVDEKIAAAVVIDSELDENSTNLLQNKTIAKSFMTRQQVTDLITSLETGYGKLVTFYADESTGDLLVCDDGYVYYTKDEADAAFQINLEANNNPSDTTLLKQYTLTQGTNSNQQTIGTIDIPKDFLVKSVSLKTATANDLSTLGGGFQTGDKYIDFVINTKTSNNQSNESHLYLNVKDLIDVYTGEKGISVGSGNKIGHSNTAITPGTNYNSNQTPAFGSTFNIPKLTYDNYGHITASANSTVKIPDSLPNPSQNKRGLTDYNFSSSYKNKLDNIDVFELTEIDILGYSYPDAIEEYTQNPTRENFFSFFEDEENFEIHLLDYIHNANVQTLFVRMLTRWGAEYLYVYIDDKDFLLKISGTTSEPTVITDISLDNNLILHIDYETVN